MTIASVPVLQLMISLLTFSVATQILLFKTEDVNVVVMMPSTSLQSFFTVSFFLQQQISVSAT
jgi:hypothetical protein